MHNEDKEPVSFTQQPGVSASPMHALCQEVTYLIQQALEDIRAELYALHQLAHDRAVTPNRVTL
jgi:hypothetical protein